MSIYPSPDKLDRFGSKYAMVILAAKRARQLKDGARKLIETRSTNPLTVALEEIAEGMIVPRQIESPSLAAHKAALKPAEPSLEDIIAAAPLIVDDVVDDMDTALSELEAFRTALPDTEDGDDAVDDGIGIGFKAEELVLDDMDMLPDEDEEESIVDDFIGDDEE
ncbi:MAG: DNA-directed RNA polymerase subunit omega [Chloroherpetonaceae bacterium]|nr:DNA-directed RNA polymerase subunit omega [Chthonomonadaceae bacterium]MDW8208114.1 DNA-directed RNA polymerase subunit omega [Chloroherpetonaceae bacterium]